MEWGSQKQLTHTAEVAKSQLDPQRSGFNPVHLL